MKITWLGTAGFAVNTDTGTFLIDPYLSRNGHARPEQPLTPQDMPDVDQIFITHGHFDHILDVPEIASQKRSAVYCSETAASALVEKGLDPSHLHPVRSNAAFFDFKDYKAQTFFSRHVQFDRLLIFKTFLRTHLQLFGLLSLMKDYPEGQVLSWRFSVEGKVIHHFGSAGSTPEELERLAEKPPIDILLVPLQGHTRICDIALDYVRVLKPKLVIPHHQDDFFPPISQEVDIRPFIEGVESTMPDTAVRKLAINETVSI